MGKEPIHHLSLDKEGEALKPEHILTPARRVAGWIFIVAGLLTVWLPIPVGLPLLVLGALLVGPRSPTLRRAGGITERMLRRWAGMRTPIVGDIGRQALELERIARRKIEEETERQAE
jgi:hypothetical protein